jgi:hypothetical protein
MGKQVAYMEDQVPPSQPATPTPVQITPEQLAEMKARAKEMAIQQAFAQQQAQLAMPQQTPQNQGFPVTATKPQVVYVRRNFTVAELILVLVMACGLVTAAQVAWDLASTTLPRIEVKIK